MGDADEKDNANGTNRRSVLRAVGATGAAGVSMGLSSVSTADSKKISVGPDEIKTEKYSGPSRKRVQRNARNDPEFQAIARRVRQKGWSLQWDDALITRVELKGEDSHDAIVVDCYKSHSNVNDEDLIIFWFGNATSELDLEYHTIGHHMYSNNVEADPDSGTFFGYDEATVLKPENGEAIEEHIDFQMVKNGTDQNPASYSIPIHTDYCHMDFCVIERDFSWPCVARMLISAGASVISCGGCIIDLTRMACIGCIMGLGMTYDQVIQCTGGYGCTYTDDAYVEEQWLDEYDIDCETYDVANEKVAPISHPEYEELPTLYSSRKHKIENKK